MTEPTLFQCHDAGISVANGTRLLNSQAGGGQMVYWD